MHVEILLSEYVLQTLMIGIDLKGLSIQIMASGFQGVYDCGKLQVMGEIIFLMIL